MGPKARKDYKSRGRGGMAKSGARTRRRFPGVPPALRLLSAGCGGEIENVKLEN